MNEVARAWALAHYLSQGWDGYAATAAADDYAEQIGKLLSGELMVVGPLGSYCLACEMTTDALGCARHRPPPVPAMGLMQTLPQVGGRYNARLDWDVHRYVRDRYGR
jgi:hypothetical protein